jgi:DNA polymerase elongation subunit (family B)
VKKKKDGTDASGGPHIEVGRLLAKRGMDIGEGTKIEYVVVDAGSSPMKVIPASDFTGEMDRHYLWETLTYPPTQGVLEVAFPAGPWKQFERSRPPKLRGQAARSAGMLSLFK